jgi:hypothetical protein
MRWLRIPGVGNTGPTVLQNVPAKVLFPVLFVIALSIGPFLLLYFRLGMLIGVGRQFPTRVGNWQGFGIWRVMKTAEPHHQPTRRELSSVLTNTVMDCAARLHLFQSQIALRGCPRWQGISIDYRRRC